MVIPARPSGTFLCVLLAGALGASGAGCRRGGSSAPLRVAHESEVISLDPLGPPEAATKSILANFHESLVGFDGDMVLVPQLAVGWETQDPTTWIFRLRPGVAFHDGVALTAHEVREALERARNEPTSGVKGSLASVRSVTEVDPLTVRLTTSRPDPLLLNRLALVPIARRDAGGFAGTGPYRPLRWTKGTPLQAEAFRDYWGGTPRFTRVVFATVPAGRDVVQALRQGSVDILRFVPENLVAEVRGIPGVRVAERAGLSSTYVWFDPRPATPRNPFSDARVRRAVSLAIDRNALVKALSGNALALDQAIPRGIFGHAAIPGVRFDPAEARRLLAESGYADGFAATLTHSPGPTSENVAGALRGMLAQVGIRLTLKGPSWKEMESDWRGARLPLFTASWRFDIGDASGFLSDCLVTRDERTGAGLYNPGYSSPALDRLVEEGERAVEPAKRLALYEQAARLLDADMPVVPLYHRYNLYGVSDRLQWHPRLDGRILVNEIARAR